MKKFIDFGLFGYLIIIFLISKELFVFNAEFLVAITFFLFIYFAVKYLSKTIAESLDSRANEIKQEFNQFVNLRLRSLDNLISYHKKNKEISEQIKNLAIFSLSQIDVVVSARENMLHNYLVQQLSERLNNFKVEELNVTDFVQSTTINSLFNDWVFNNYSSKYDDNNNSLKTTLLINNILNNLYQQTLVNSDQLKLTEFISSLNKLKMLTISKKELLQTSTQDTIQIKTCIINKYTN